jgi:predicted CXXCH cytochrome family protein
MTPPGYPADEGDRIPEGLPGAGYFEVSSGGDRLPGVEHRERWPGAIVFEDERILPGGHAVSPHRTDPEMPRRSPEGQGLCLNCHDPHGTPYFDLLVAPYGPIGGWKDPGPPQAYALCFQCHGRSGPPGMDQENQWIEDYYDMSLQGDDTAGHAIRLSSDSALSWPGYVRRGDRLPCYDCHNPHGSRGYDGAHPNAFLLSDQRPGWSGLTDTRTDPEQNRRFCFGCHIPSDGVPGSQTVEGIVMNTIPDEVPEHASTATEGCFSCHGSAYDGPLSFNVHHPRIPENDR